jgi:hypothetical protein
MVMSRERKLLVACSIWLAAVAATLFFWEELFNLLFVGVIFPVMALVGTGVFLCAWVVLLLCSGHRSRAIPLAVLIPFAVLSFLFLDGFNQIWLAHFHLLGKRHYEAVVARIQASPPGDRYNLSAADCIISKESPLRVAFVRPDFHLFTCEAVVYDPTGLVVSANERELAPEVTGLSCGHLVRAAHLEGPWYLCEFA